MIDKLTPEDNPTKLFSHFPILIFKLECMKIESTMKWPSANKVKRFGRIGS